MNTRESECWYVVHTKPRQESRALQNLTNQGYDCYLPLHKKKVLLRGALQIQSEPLFSRYMFIQLDSSQSGKSWAPIRSTLGVSTLVVFGTEPARVDSSLIHAFKAHEQHLTERDVAPLFTKGDQVLIVEGPLSGLTATFQMEDGELRAMVLIDLLSQARKMKLPLAALRLAA